MLRRIHARGLSLAVAGLLALLVAGQGIPAGAAPRPVSRAAAHRSLARAPRRPGDRIVDVAGDATGLHVLAASGTDGYAWRTVATLAAPGVDTTEWIGQACMTGDERHAVVVYAPRQITNDPQALGDGALAAVVDLSTGRVTPVRAGVSIAYFDPGCGAGDQAVLTQGGTGAGLTAAHAGDTRLLILNAATGRLTRSLRLPGQVTSAVPYEGSIAAVTARGVVGIGPAGQARLLAAVPGTAFGLVPDRRGGLGFEVATARSVQVRRYAAGGNVIIGSAPLGSVDLSQAGGRVFVTGPRATRLGRLPGGWRALDVPADAQVSSTGALAVTSVSTPPNERGRSPLADAPDQAQPVRITAVLTGETQAAGDAGRMTFTVPAARPPATGLTSAAPAGPGPAGPSPATPSTATAASPNPATTTYDPDRSCSVPRNDPAVQTYQPSAAQVEWAADEAVQGKLTVRRPAHLYGSSLPAYSPQGLFPLPALSGGGRVPAPVLLGVLAQESNEQQASPHAIIGQTGNFNPSYNWYGNGGSYNFVDWASSDCGYGIAQVTTGMCRTGYHGCTGPLPATSQLVVAVDFQANIAAGLRLLAQKYNQLRALKITTNGGGNPKYVENWWLALWAYNSGLEPDAANGNTTGCSPSPSCTDSGGNWGLGWVNNPANPVYPPGRPMFGEDDKLTKYNYTYDTMHPQYWSYEEKVTGFAAYGFVGYDYLTQKYGNSFVTSYYPNGPDGTTVPPSAAEPEYGRTFCDSSDRCDSSHPAAPCQLTSGANADHCWWHEPVSWTTCPLTCGQQSPVFQRYHSDPGDPGVPKGYAPACTAKPLPASAVIVGDAESVVPSPLGCGLRFKPNGGIMTWKFAADVGKNTTTYPSKIDFHQIGGGYSGHYWFTHTIPSGSSDPASVTPEPSDADQVVTGTWTPPKSVTGWTRIMVQIPNEGAWDPEANYQVHTGTGTEHAIVDQAFQSDTWADLGIYRLSAGASVSLSNVTALGLGDDIAWDAVAFVKAAAPRADYVALGDSYSSGEGNTPYEPNSDWKNEGSTDACHRSVAGAYAKLVALPGHSDPIAAEARTLNGSYDFHFVACSGAESPNVSLAALDDPPTAYDEAGHTDWGQAADKLRQYGEAIQADAGYLTPRTTLVTMTIGGNDIRFADVMGGCVKAAVLHQTACNNPKYFLVRGSGAKDPKPLVKFEPIVIGLLKEHLERTYEAIRQEAPNAETIILGYPPLFARKPASSCRVGPGLAGVGAYLSVSVQKTLNTWGADMNQQLAAAVAAVRAKGMHIRFLNPAAVFSGHELCSKAPWIYSIKAFTRSGSGFNVIDPGSFHPNVPGQRGYAQLVSKCLAGKLGC